MTEIGDRVVYHGPQREFWGQIGIVRERLPGGERMLEFKDKSTVRACPTELLHTGDQR